MLGITYKQLIKRNDLESWQVAMVKWLRQTAHNQEVVILKPDTVYWMDVSNASYYSQTCVQRPSLRPEKSGRLKEVSDKTEI